MKLLLFLPFFLFNMLAFGGPGDEIIRQLNERIDELQYEIDSKDGVTDGNIDLPNPYTAKRAQKLYFTITDSLQRVITDKDQPWMRTRDELRTVKNWLVDTNPNQFDQDIYLDRFEICYYLFSDINLDLVQRKLRQQPKLAIDLYDEYQDKSFSFQVLKSAVDKDPDLFMRNAWQFGDTNEEIQQIVDELVNENPIKMKRWVGTGTAMGRYINQSTDSATILFRNLFNQYGRASKSYYLMDHIANGKMTAREAENVSKDVDDFRKQLIQLSIKDHILADEAVEERLAEESLRVVRTVNDLHETKNPAIRFKSVEGMNADEFYTWMVYTQEEIFTSTYNGFYERFLKQLGKQSGAEFLQSMNYNRYRTFLKMAAGYGTLQDFLSTMSEEKQKQLLTKFVSNLEDGSIDNSLQASVDVADTFGSLSDQDLKDFFSEKMKEEFERVSNENNQHGIRIYSLLNGILAQSSDYSDEWMNRLVEEYDIPKINELQHQQLLNKDGKIIEQVFFYDDKDGKASYNSFLPSFQNSQWRIEDKNTFIKITSDNKKVEVYANKPQYEFKGKADLRHYFKQEGIVPSVVIHRGHSFYVDTTIHSLTPNAKLVMLGSCGGYHNLTSVLDRSPDVHIISSKQIGSMGINDPMIRLMNKKFVAKKDIQWKSFWDTLGSQLKGNSTNYSRFQDYVPPHKNLGAIFIMAYNRLKAKDEGRS